MNPSAGSFFSWKELTWAGSCKKSSAGWAAPQQSWVQGGSILESFSKGFCFKNPNILGHISLPPLWNTETKIQGVFFVFALLVLGCFSFPQPLTYKMWYLHYKNLIFFLTRIDSEAKCFSKMGRAWLGSVFTGGWECHSPIFPIFPPYFWASPALRMHKSTEGRFWQKKNLEKWQKSWAKWEVKRAELGQSQFWSHWTSLKFWNWGWSLPGDIFCLWCHPKFMFSVWEVAQCQEMFPRGFEILKRQSSAALNIQIQRGRFGERCPGCPPLCDHTFSWGQHLQPCRDEDFWERE